MNPIIPDCTIPGKEWETVVQNKKQEVLNERSKNLPTRKNDPVSVQHLDEVTSPNYGLVLFTPDFMDFCP